MTWKAAARKGLRVIVRKIIGCAAMVDHRLYMSLYRRYLRWAGVVVEGRGPRYVAASARLDGTDFALIRLGEDSVISSDVLVLTHDFSPARRDQVNARDGGTEGSPERSKIDGIAIGANSFVGARSVLLPGVNIGRDCIVGAGSVVRGRVEDGSITIGNPARIVGSVYDADKDAPRPTSNSAA